MKLQSSRRRLTLLVLCFCALVLRAQVPRPGVREADVRLRFAPDRFVVELPVAAASSAAAQVSVDLLDTLDAVRAHGAASCALQSGDTLCKVALVPTASSAALDDRVALYRLRYRIEAPPHAPLAGTLAVDHIAPTLYVLHAAMPENVRPGSSYSIRVRATHPFTHVPQPNVSLEASVTADVEDRKEDATVVRRRLTTNADGFATLDFTAPSNPKLNSVTVLVQGSLVNLHDAIRETINTVSQRSLALATDRPLYQPGQTVHLRVLSLDQTGRAQPNAKLTFDVRDPDSTLVFRTEADTSRFGIAAADWQVPARLRLGPYNIRVAHRSNADDDDTDNSTASAQVRISRYDLPTFTVTPKPDKPFYLPGQNAAVEVRGLYLFGKPVVHGHVRVVRETQRSWNADKQKYDTEEGAVYQGALDKDGVITAHVDLAADEKEYREDDVYTDSNAYQDLHLAAYLTDESTGRTEQRRFDLRISHQPLHVQVIRDATAPAGLPLGFTVSVNTADGFAAANATVRIALLPRASNDPKETDTQRAAHALALTEVHTDAYGLARVDGLPQYAELLRRMPPPVLPLKPDPSSDDTPPQPELLASAHTADGRDGVKIEQIEEPSAILRITTDHALYKPGDPIRITITSAQPSLPVNVQLLRNTQSGPLTLATQNVTLRNGRATLTLASGTSDKPDPRFSGYITVAAVALAQDLFKRTPWGYKENPASAFHTILLPRDNALHVAVKLQRSTYRPGDTATAGVEVSGPQDSDGDDHTAARFALGVVAIDQAVNERNRSDNEFGNSGSFFFPWRSSFASQHIVAGLTLADIEQRDPYKPFTPEFDLAASVLLNEDRDVLKLTDNAPDRSGANAFNTLLEQRTGSARKALQDYLKTHDELPTTAAELDSILARGKLSISTLRDPWDKPFRLTTSVNYSRIYLRLSSDGPDKLPNTADDFDLNLAEWNWFAHHESELRNAVYNYRQRTKSFIRDLPTLTAALHAEGIDITTWRDPWGQPFTYAFGISQTDYTITADTLGPPAAQGHTRRTPFQAGSAGISWFTDQRLLIQNALASFANGHAFPTTETDFNAALRRSGIPPFALADPWGHVLVPTFHTRSIFTDRVSVEARGNVGETPQKRTTVTPVTAIVDTIDLNSLGPDGKRGKLSPDGYSDDFVAASFSHIRSEQSAKQAAPQAAPATSINSGEPEISTGTLVGTVSDPSGAVIPEASVVATNDATREEFEAHSDKDGSYVLGPVPAGTYTVRVEFSGFTTTVIDHVHVLSPEATLLDIKLSVGTASETVEVSASAVSVSTESASNGSLQGMSGGVTGGILGGLAGGRVDKRVMFANLTPPPPPPPAGGTPRIREYFPETLLWRPEVLTAEDGSASLRFPVADTITSWQLSVAASTLRGNTGAGAAGFSTFLPFFAAFDPPQVLTVGDHLALPITLRNYLDHPVNVQSTLTPTPWLRVDTPPAATTLAAQESASPITRITALAPVTSGKLLFTARPNADAGDSMERAVTIHPDGLETAVTTAGIVRGPTTFTLTIPADALPGTDATLKLYPNLGAHLRDALVAMAAYPDGCAEQITSIAWPSLLLERYAAKLPARDKKLRELTRLRLEAAYANLLSDRDSSGGFKYWSNSQRPDLALTAYVIQFLTAARQFIAVDDNVIKSAVDYLGKQQTAAGLWIALDYQGLPRTHDKDGNAMLTASIAAMIADAPEAEPLITKALAATQPFTDSIDEPYTLANYALAAIAVKATTRSVPAISRLRSLAQSENGGAYWSLETNTPFFGWGRAGRVEATAAALRALLSAGATPRDDLVTRGLLFLDHQQDRHSLWYSTQATARTLDVLAAIALSGGPAQAGQGKPGSLTVRIDGASIASVALAPGNTDSGPLFVPLGTALAAGAHKITLDVPAEAAAATAQIVANYYEPWPASAPASATTNNEQLRLAVHFDTTTAAPATPIHATAHIERLGFRGYGMLIAEIGLPPGADVDRATLETAVADSGYTLSHYEILPDKLLLYLWPEAGGYDLHFSFTLRYAVDALTAPSAVYDYYNPDARFDLPPQRFTTP